MDDASILDELWSRQQITDVIRRRARAADRFDVDLARTCYHEGATEDHGGFLGPVEEYLAWSPISGDEERAAMWHCVAAPLIDLDGDVAISETYVYVVETVERDGEHIDASVGGRYLDRFERREGRWAIVHRQLVLDWSRCEPATARYWDVMGLDVDRIPFGAAGGNDPLAAFVRQHGTTTRS